MFTEMDQKTVQAIRSLSIDAINKANSGHPGIVMGAAPMAYVLWSKVMIHNPANPNWLNRDRFILSAGHGSMLLYSLLHLSGYDLSLEEIKHFRQFGSKTPGHPEYKHTVGVEATTGPLGQGIATAVGMAMAERHLAAVYNQENEQIIDHNTYVLCGDGDLMEGVASEASSLAAHLHLGRLIVLYDSNSISLDGELNMSCSENIGQRYEAYGWQYIQVADGNNLEAIYKALIEAKTDLERPTLIEIKTTIGYGSPNRAGTSKVHGAPLGLAESKLAKNNWEWPHEEFYIPMEIYDHFKNTLAKNSVEAEEDWNNRFVNYKNKFKDLARQLEEAHKQELPFNWNSGLVPFNCGEAISTRDASGIIMNTLADYIPYFWGGSADLASSNKTYLHKKGNFQANDYKGRNIWFGVREFAMGACLNGMTLHGGLKSFGGTFFVFSDYLRPAVRMSSLMELPVIYVFTHDSIAVGEDGPTHEPVEQLAAFRSMPNLVVFRPADANETLVAWQLAVTLQATPSLLVLSRQNLPVLDTEFKIIENGVKRGAYVVSEAKNKPVTGLLLATGSEVSLAIAAQKVLADRKVYVNVISMPAWELFEQQDKAYKESVLPNLITKRVAIEAGSSQGWHRYTGLTGAVIAIDEFGASGNGELLMEKYGFTVENIVNTFTRC